MKRTLMLVLLSAVFLSRLGPSDETCCPKRYITMMPTPMPPGQEYNLSDYFEEAVLSPLINDAINSIDAGCPEISIFFLGAKAAADDRDRKIDQAVSKQLGKPANASDPKPSPPQTDMHYVLRGTLTADQVTGKDLSGHLEGKFSFQLKLVDHHHGDAVVREGSTSWSGGIMEGGDEVQSLASSFRPLPPLLKGYERIAEKATIEVPNDRVEAGHTVTITLSELYDKDGRQTQKWQRLFVHIEKGKILNAEQVVKEDQKEYNIFRADDGRVKIQYQAPDECQKVRETLTVFNCCEKREPPSFLGLDPKKEIGKKEFDIVCNRWNVELTFTKKVAGKEQMSEGITREVGWSYSATVKAVVEFVRSSGSDRIYESKSSDLDFTDNFWQHIVVKTEDHTCEGRLSWLGTHKGTIKVPVRMKIHTRANRCSFGFGPREGEGPIIFKMGINLWGDEKCGGAKAWQGESPVKDVLFDASGVDLENHIPKPIPFSPGQKEISGQDQWSSRLWLRFYEVKVPIDLSQFPVLSRPLLVLLTASQMMSDKIPANATLSWKATKLGQKD
jgi:hypothetical protein